MLEAVLGSMAESDPVQHDVFLAAALPRSFDSETVSAALGLDSASPEVRAAVDALAEHPLVERRADGTLALHDLLRTEVLDYLREAEPDGEWRAQLTRLRDFYMAKWEAARQADAALDQTGSVIRSVSPSRYVQICAVIGDSVIKPAIDAVETAMMLAPQEGLETFQDIFFRQETDRKYWTCELLVRALQAAVRRMPPGHLRTLHKSWAAYFSARIAIAVADWKSAEQALQRMPPVPESEVVLRLWTASLKVDLLSQQARFSEALAVLAEAIELSETSHADPWNLPVLYSRRVNLAEQLWHLDDQVSFAEKGIETAVNAKNTRLEVQLQVRLALALSMRGDRRASLEHLLWALYRARTELPEWDEHIGDSLWSALDLVGRASPRVFATIARQLHGVMDQSWPDGEFAALLREASLLAQLNATQRAEAAFDRARALAAEHLPAREWEVEVERAAHAEQLARAAEGAAFNIAEYAAPTHADDPWTQVRCLTNAAYLSLVAGDLSQAGRCVQEASGRWAAMSHAGGVALSAALMAEVLRREGKCVEAEPLIDSLKWEVLGPHAAEGYEIRARIAYDRCRWESAASDARLSAETSSNLGDRQEAAQVRLLASAAFLRLGRHDAAAREAELAGELAMEIAAFNSWTDTAATAEANAHVDRALRVFVRGMGTRAARCRAAREHLNAAAKLDPENPWTLMERALLDLADDRPSSARSYLAHAERLWQDKDMATALHSFAARVAPAEEG